MALNRTLAALSVLAAASVLVMVAAILATGFFSQEFFELGPSPALVAEQKAAPGRAEEPRTAKSRVAGRVIAKTPRDRF